jgi:hypothetical protein
MSGMLCVASATESRRVGAGSRGRRVFFFSIFLVFSFYFFFIIPFYFLFLFLFICISIYFCFSVLFFLLVFIFIYISLFLLFYFFFLSFYSSPFSFYFFYFDVWFVIYRFFSFNQYCMWVMSSICFLLHACTPTPESSFLERHRGNLLLKRNIRAPRKHAEPRPDDSNLQRRDVKLSLKRYIVFAGQPSSMANQKSRDLCMDES